MAVSGTGVGGRVADSGVRVVVIGAHVDTGDGPSGFTPPTGVGVADRVTKGAKREEGG